MVGTLDPDLMSTSTSTPSETSRPWWLKLLLILLGLGVAALLAISLLVGVIMAVAYPQLPDVSELADYRPKLPLRIYSSDNQLLGEFGEERRKLTPIQEIPKVMKDAVLSIEDARFYQHGGVDYLGLLRASLANIGHTKSQGASTITMQVARNVYLSSEKTYTRKIFEILLTYKLENALSKDQILEIYMNQIYLGNRSYGFASAAETYFGKPLKDITVAEAAMLAGLPKAPSAYNPFVNPKRARVRQLYIIERMLENGFITQAQAEQARQEPMAVRAAIQKNRIHAEYVAEMVRQMMFAKYGADTYTSGLNVYTTILAQDQQAAYDALRKGIMDFERRQIYRGPEKFIDLPKDPKEAENAIDDVLEEHPDNGDVMSAVVLQASRSKVVVVRQNGEQITITGAGLQPAESGLSDKAAPNVKLRPGAVIRVLNNGKNWEITQLPEVEGAFVAVTPQTGALRSLVGGFDFNKNKFNHVTQAWRQPGSSFKPFIYSAALEKGFSPATIVNDAPLFFDAGVTGGQPWEPKNYDGTFDGPMTLRKGLAKSKNMISIRVLQAIGARDAQQWITHFGFDEDKHPPYLTMALGAGSATPMQMVVGYSAFANGGYRVTPYLINKVTDAKGATLFETPAPTEPPEETRAISARNAFVMSTLLQEVTRSGTAARAQATLQRPDLYGKTGTTNDAMDAWFAGYQPHLAAIVWIGYDNPRKLGSHETGGGLALPIWIQFMSTALKGEPVAEVQPTAGVVFQNGDWYFDEFAGSQGVTSLGLGQGQGGDTKLPKPDERSKILDLFRN